MPTWEDVVDTAKRLPEVEESTWFRTPSLKVAGKGFARLRTEAEGGLVLMCDLDEKAALLPRATRLSTRPRTTTATGRSWSISRRPTPAS